MIAGLDTSTPVTSVAVTMSPTTILVTQTSQATAILNGGAVTGRLINWSVTNSSKASISGTTRSRNSRISSTVSSDCPEVSP